MPDGARPSFIDAWLTDLLDDIRRYGLRKLVPWAVISSAALGALVTWCVPREFWAKPEISVVFFTAAVTVNGLLLALSWGSFAKIYEIAAEPRMAGFLRRHGLLNTYIFHVDFIHGTQVLALCCSGAALILCVITNLPPTIAEFVPIGLLQQISLGACVASSTYALKYALGAVRIMQDLVWNSAYLLDHPEPEIAIHEGGRDRR